MSPNYRIRFHLLENALDYLLSAAEHASLRSSRSWKYAILHLVAGIELLLKARLQNEHWSLLFQRVDQASDTALRSGNFISVDFETAYNRLKNIAGVTIDKSDLDYLNELRDIRNRVQHFAIEVEIAQVISLLVKGINFSLEFSRTNLSEQMTPMETQVGQIYRRLQKFQEFVTSRLEEIQPQLEVARDLIGCRVCWQDTLKIGDGDPHCPFCGFRISAEELANTLGEGSLDEKCLECGAETMCFILYNNDFGVDYCTTCGTTQRVCPNCHSRYIGDSEYCINCQADAADLPAD